MFEVARKDQPPKLIVVCKLEQSVAATRCRGKMNLESGQKGKPSQEMLVARVGTLDWQMKGGCVLIAFLKCFCGNYIL